MWLIINIILILVIIAMFAYPYINKFRIKSVAKIVDNADFAEQIVGGQLIDLRESSAFRIVHILGARNLPFSQFDQSISAIRKDKAVLTFFRHELHLMSQLSVGSRYQNIHYRSCLYKSTL